MEFLKRENDCLRMEMGDLATNLHANKLIVNEL